MAGPGAATPWTRSPRPSAAPSWSRTLAPAAVVERPGRRSTARGCAPSCSATSTPAAAALVARLGLATATGPVRTPAAARGGHGRALVRAGPRRAATTSAISGCSTHEGTVDRARPARARRRGRPRRCGPWPVERPAADDRASRRRAAPAGRARRVVRTLTLRPALDEPRAPRPDARVVVRAPGGSGGWAVPGDAASTSSRLPRRGDQRAAGAAGGAATWRCGGRMVTRRALRAGARLAAPTWDALGAWRLVVEAPETISPGGRPPGRGPARGRSARRPARDRADACSTTAATSPPAPTSCTSTAPRCTTGSTGSRR